MRLHMLTIGLNIFLGIALSGFVHGTDWKWYSGGGFNAIGANAAPSRDQQDIWLGGEVLVRGRWLGNYWDWTPMAEDLTLGRRILTLDVRTFPAPDGEGESVYLMAVTDDNRILYSSNEGVDWAEWAAPAPGSLGGLQKVVIAGPNLAFAAGQNNSEKAVLMKTENGGETWSTLFDSHDHGIFRDLVLSPGSAGTEVSSFLLAGSCHNSDEEYGVVVEVIDDWDCRVEQYFDHPIWAVAWPSAEEKYALGGGEQSDPILAYAVDMLHWSTWELPSDVSRLFAMQIEPGGRGLLVGSFGHGEAGTPAGGLLLETRDGGVSWERTEFCENCSPRSPIPLAALHLLASVNERVIAIQSGGSTDWPCRADGSQRETCPGVVLDSPTPKGVEMVERKWSRIEKLSGHSYRLGASIDHPAKWSYGLLLGYDTNPLYGISEVLLPEGQMADVMPRFDSDCLDLHTGENGNCFVEWTGLSVVETETAWSVGNLRPGAEEDVGAILRFNASSGSWTAEKLDPMYVVRKMGEIQADDSGLVWCSAWVFDSVLETNERILFVSNDDGQTWREIRREPGTVPYNFIFGSAEFGCIYSLESTVCTSDGGDTWTEPQEFEAVRAVSLLGEQGWAVTPGGGVYGTKDSGQSWVELGSIPSLDVSLLEPSSFLFTDSTSGWYSGPMEPNWEAGIAGRIGIWKSEDGGKTWEPDFILNSSTGPSESGRAALLALDETGRGWAVSPSTGLIFSRAMTGPGDANGNGIIDSGDYVVIANSLFKDPPDQSHDCNQDGSIDSGDLLCILRRLIK